MVLKTLEPDEYQNIHNKIRTTRKQREKYINEFSKPINSELNVFNIQAEIKIRAKHYYSILGKMRKQNRKFEEIFDLFAIRVVVNKIEELNKEYTVKRELALKFGAEYKNKFNKISIAKNILSLKK